MHTSDLQLFFSTFGIIFLAEFPDKTALATVVMASQLRATGVFVGVAMAFVIQTLIAVLAGGVFSLLPEKWVQVGAALIFLFFAWKAWTEEPEAKEGEKLSKGSSRKSFWGSAYTAFVVIFLAEWGDLTQLSTMALTAKYHKPHVIGAAAILGLWGATGISVLIGHHSKKFINPRVLQKVAAVVFLGVGLFLLARVFI